MKNKIVVARYNEPTDWLDKINQNKYDILIYNKGEGTVKFEIQKLPNIGRESHTYLTYIVDNYENLTDFTIFLQANPFDHLGNLNKISNMTIDEFINSYEFDGNIFGFGIYHQDCGHIPERENIAQKIKLLNDIKPNCSTVFSVGAQLIVSKQIILNKPIEFWKELKYLHENINDIVDTTLFPCIIERMWFQIFK